MNTLNNDLTDLELYEKAQKTLSELCKTGAKSFVMSVPPKKDDTDMVFAELLNRFKMFENKIMLLEEDLECAHLYFDDFDIPRTDSKGEKFSIPGRTNLLKSKIFE